MASKGQMTGKLGTYLPAAVEIARIKIDRDGTIVNRDRARNRRARGRTKRMG